MKIFLEHQIVSILKEAEVTSLSKSFTGDMLMYAELSLPF